MEGRKGFEIKVKEFVRKFKPSLELTALVNALRDFVFLRTYTTEASQELFYTARTTLFKEVASRLHMDNRQVVALSADELSELLVGQSMDASRLIRERQKGYAIIALDKQVTSIYGESANELQAAFRSYLFSVHDLGRREVKGSPAFMGKVSGRVKVVLNHRDISSVEEGDVLVTSMTTPEFTIAMGRASAFVTDEGGITCHAAIIAREMKVPCVVGTRNATKVLKNGDYVEVDANNGVVRVMEK